LYHTLLKNDKNRASFLKENLKVKKKVYICKIIIPQNILYSTICNK
jgi:hypothetical protein